MKRPSANWSGCTGRGGCRMRSCWPGRAGSARRRSRFALRDFCWHRARRPGRQALSRPFRSDGACGRPAERCLSPRRGRWSCRPADCRARLGPAPQAAARRDPGRGYARDRRVLSTDCGGGGLAGRHRRRRRRDEPQRRQCGAENPRRAALRQALLLLVSHNPGRLLPTIRSRCRRVKMTPLTLAPNCSVRHRPQLATMEADAWRR